MLILIYNVFNLSNSNRWDHLKCATQFSLNITLSMKWGALKLCQTSKIARKNIS